MTGGSDVCSSDLLRKTHSFSQAFANAVPLIKQREIDAGKADCSSVRKAKSPNQVNDWGLSLINSLTMSYFHTGVRTIIGAKAFHCPVRDGKEWGHLAMVIRLDWQLCC